MYERFTRSNPEFLRAHYLRLAALLRSGQGTAVDTALQTARRSVPETAEKRYEAGVYLFDIVNGMKEIAAADANKLLVARETGAGLSMLVRTFDRPMGLAVHGDRLALGTRDQVWQFRNAPDIAPLVVYLLEGDWWVGVALGLIAVVMATLGDLCESVIKRDLGIKDMSQVIPGHGGLMDRLDSLLATIAPIWLLLHYLVF